MQTGMMNMEDLIDFANIDCHANGQNFEQYKRL